MWLNSGGAGHGTRALIAELIGGEIARCLQLRIPEIVFLYLDEAFGRTEGDEEIQDLLKNSQGINLGLHYLSGALTYDPAVTTLPAGLASRIVWMDAFLTNVDRTVKNTNMLIWNKELWLIDHGACLYFHSNWDDTQQKALNPFPMIKEHVLLQQANQLLEADAFCKNILTNDTIREIVDLIPNDWLNWSDIQTPEEMREIYFNFLTERLAYSEIFVKEALNAKEILV